MADTPKWFEPPIAGPNSQVEGLELIDKATDFGKSPSRETAKAFAQEWQAAVKANQSYGGQYSGYFGPPGSGTGDYVSNVECFAKREAQDDWLVDPSVKVEPAAIKVVPDVEFDPAKGRITFQSNWYTAHVGRSSTYKIEASNDGGVVAQFGEDTDPQKKIFTFKPGEVTRTEPAEPISSTAISTPYRTNECDF
jgi:hypothetical protein